MSTPCPTVEEFLAHLNALVDEDDQIEYIYDVTHDWFMAGDFVAYDRVLGSLLHTYDRYGVIVLLAFLVPRNWFPDKGATQFANFAAYGSVVRSHLEAVRPNDVEDLLRGLE